MKLKRSTLKDISAKAGNVKSAIVYYEGACTTSENNGLRLLKYLLSERLRMVELVRRSEYSKGYWYACLSGDRRLSPDAFLDLVRILEEIGY